MSGGVRRRRAPRVLRVRPGGNLAADRPGRAERVEVGSGGVPVMTGEDAVGWGLVRLEAALRGETYSSAYKAVGAIVDRFTDAELREVAVALAVLVRPPYLGSVRVEDVQNLRTQLAYLWGD